MAIVAQNLFLGIRKAEMDESGRVVVPTDWKPNLKGSLVLARGIEQCLLVYPRARFWSIGISFDNLGLELSDVRKWVRYLFGTASEVSVDDRGRLSIPPALRTFAGLSQQVTLMGVIDHIEIWNDQKYDALEANLGTDIVGIAERVGKLIQETDRKVTPLPTRPTARGSSA